MQSRDDAELRRECRVFCRYLIGREPSAYIVAKYVSGHASWPEAVRDDALDRALLACASTAPWMTGVADTYAALARRQAVLRRKLILLLAILENAADTHTACDTPIASGRAATVARIAVSGLAWTGRVLVSVVVFGVVHLVTATTGGRRG
jgi:hypothetical protein